MTGSRLGLAVLTAIALALGLALALGGPPAAVPRGARLVPGLEPARVERIVIARGGGEIVLARGDAGWRVEAPAPAGPADPAVVADVLGALELASATRWVGAGDAARAGAGLDAPRVTVTAVTARGARTLAIGGDAGGGLAWARPGGEARAALVEGWVARALDRDAAALRVRAPAPVARPTGIELHAGGVDLVASGAPLRVHLPGGAARLAPARARALAGAIAALRFVRFPDEPPGAAAGTLRVLGGPAVVELDDLGPCPGAPGDRWLGGTAGAGCVAGPAWRAVLDEAAAIAGDPAAAIDPVPLGPGSIATVALGDAVATRRGGDWTLAIGGEDADADVDAIRALVAALAAPARVVPLAAPGVPAPPLTVTYDDGAVDALSPAGAGALRRNAEPFALAVDPALLARLARGPGGLVDATLLAEEPWALREIEARGRDAAVVTRGATHDAWAAAGGGRAADRAAVAAIRDLTARLRADEVGGAPPAPVARTVVLTFDPPPAVGAAEVVRVIELAAPGRDGRCRAAVDGAPGLLPAAACRALLAPLVR